MQHFDPEKTGKCATCAQEKTLDTMLRKENTRGLYHCKDCEVEHIHKEPSIELPAVPAGRLRLLFRWLIGALLVVPLVRSDTAFTSTPEAMTYILFYGIWLAALSMLFTLRGPNGGFIGAINLFQVVIGVALATRFFGYSSIIALSTLGVSLVVFAGAVFLQ